MTRIGLLELTEAELDALVFALLYAVKHKGRNDLRAECRSALEKTVAARAAIGTLPEGLL